MTRFIETEMAIAAHGDVDLHVWRVAWARENCDRFAMIHSAALMTALGSVDKNN